MLIFLISIYIAGFLMFLSPCVFPIIPIYLSVLEREGKKILNTFLFILGLSLTFISLGYGFGIIGAYIYSPLTKSIAGLIIIIMGLNQLEVIKFNFLNRTRLLNIKKIENSSLESFVLGLTFSLGWTPCIGPLLTVVLGYAGDSQSAIYGAFLLFIFVLGFATPFLIFTIMYNKLENKILIIKKNSNIIKKISAILIIILGILLIFDKLYILSF